MTLLKVNWSGSRWSTCARDQVADHLGHRAIGVEPAVGGVAVVAAEQLVAAVAAEHDLHLARGHAREVQQADGERIGRLVQRGDEPRQIGADRRASPPPRSAACRTAAPPRPRPAAR